MQSKVLAGKKIGYKEGFRWRGEEITRIEGLSDAVFAFAVTLLIVSLEVPKTFDELLASLRGFGAFAACFTLLMAVWYRHYIYCRLYGLQDTTTVVLSLILLFLVLFYTYPLKFLFTQLLDPSRRTDAIKSYDQLAQLFTIYALGYVAVFAVFTIMYARAYRLREQLKLNRLELWDAKHNTREMVLHVALGLVSFMLANTMRGEWISSAGFIFAFAGPLFWIHGSWSGRKRSVIYKEMYGIENPNATDQTDALPIELP